VPLILLCVSHGPPSLTLSLQKDKQRQTARGETESERERERERQRERERERRRDGSVATLLYDVICLIEATFNLLSSPRLGYGE